MSLKKIVTLLVVESKKSKAGNVYAVAQCLIEGDSIAVGRLNLFGDKAATVPGTYEAEFDIAVDREGQVEARIVALLPIKARAGTISEQLQAKVSSVPSIPKAA